MAPKYLFNCLNVPNEFSKYVLQKIMKEREREIQREKVRKWKSEKVEK